MQQRVLKLKPGIQPSSNGSSSCPKPPPPLPSLPFSSSPPISSCPSLSPPIAWHRPHLPPTSFLQLKCSRIGRLPCRSSHSLRSLARLRLEPRRASVHRRTPGGTRTPGSQGVGAGRSGETGPEAGPGSQGELGQAEQERQRQRQRQREGERRRKGVRCMPKRGAGRRAGSSLCGDLREGCARHLRQVILP
eukprot:766917-Hanusia_phi.AAC.5